MTDFDPVNKPKHYNSHPSGIECIQITRHMGFNLGNAFKYIWRADLKNGIEDLEKAIWYLQDEIKLRKEKQDGRRETGKPPTSIRDVFEQAGRSSLPYFSEQSKLTDYTPPRAGCSGVGGHRPCCAETFTPESEKGVCESSRQEQGTQSDSHEA